MCEILNQWLKKKRAVHRGSSENYARRRVCDVSVTDLRCTAKPTKDERFVGRILAITLLLEAVDRATAARNSGIRSSNALLLGASLHCRGP